MDIGKGAVRRSAGRVKARLLKWWLITAAIVVLATAGFALADGESPPLSIAGPPTVISTATVLPASATAAAIKVPFSQIFPATGGTAPYTWSLAGEGTLPDGLSLDSSTGEISGTPTAYGLFPVTIQVTDSVGAQSSRDWTFNFSDGLRPGWPRELHQRSGAGNLPQSSSPILADLDGDGKADIITADLNTLYVHSSDGTVRSVDLPGTVTTPAVADLDGDGQKEIIVSLANASTSNMIYAFHADLTPVAGFPAGAYSNGTSGYVSSPVVEDFNYDGKLKIAVVTSPADSSDPSYGNSVLLMVDSQGGIVPGWPKMTGPHPLADAPPAVGDIYHYGRKEMLVTTLDGYVSTWWSDGTMVEQWRYGKNADYTPVTVDDAQTPVVADINGDGYLDVIIKYHTDAGNFVTVLDHMGDLMWTWPRQLDNGAATPYGVVVADIDGNGSPDVVVPSNDVMYAFSAFGSTQYWGRAEIWIYGYGNISPNSHPVVADINGDGQAEVLVTTTDAANNSWLLAIDAYGRVVMHYPDGDLAGFPKNISVGSGVRSTPAIGDLDGNGKLDVVVRSEDGFLWGWELQQTGSVLAKQWPMYRRNPQHTASINQGYLAWSESQVNFYAAVGTSSSPQRFTLGNWSDHPLPLSFYMYDQNNPFTLDPGTCGGLSFTLQPYQSCTAYVTFTPSFVGYTQSTLQVVNWDNTVYTPEQLYLEGNGMQPTYQLSYTKSGDGNGVVTTSTGNTYSGAGSETVPYNSWVTFTAAPAAGSKFTGWGGSQCYGTGDCSVLMNGDITVTASFTLKSYSITATAGANGSISGPASATYGATATYTMTPAAGYKVADVLVDGVSVGALTSYSFSNVSSNHTISASFAVDVYGITATAGDNGSITGPATVGAGGSASYSITPATGYHVADVVVDGVSVGAVTSYSFSNVTATHTISASFAINSYNIALNPGPNGSISGPATVTYGASAYYTITPATGYEVAEVVVDGVSNGKMTGIGWGSVISDHTISATFSIKSYDITIGAVVNGSISGPASVTYGGNATYTITPATGYHVTDVLVDGGSVGAVTSYTFQNVSASHTISAIFALNSYDITATAGANGSIYGPASVTYGNGASYSITPATGYHVADVLVDGVSVGAVTSYSFSNVTATHTIAATFAPNSYNVTATAGANGSISGPSSATYGSSASYSITPASGYHIADVLVDGVSVGAVTSYTFSNVTSAHTISASFVSNSFTVTLNAGPNGSISGPTTVPYGASASYAITPATGYEIAEVVVDGFNYGKITGLSWDSVTSNHTISATFSIKNFNITATAGANGSISGPATATYGGSASYSITPAAGYVIANVVVDGASIGAVSSYTFTNVTENHTISATFAVQSDLTVTSVTSPTSASRGRTISVSAGVSNQGGGNAGSFKVAFYLSLDGAVTSSDVFLGTQTVSSLNAGGTTTVSGSFIVPAGMATGKYYVGAVVDSDSVISESNENNNTRAAATTTTIK